MARKKSVATTAPAAMTKRARPAKASSPVKEAGERAMATAKKSGRHRGPTSVAVAKRDEGQQAGNTSFPVAGIGASAGGLEAFRQLLEHLPVDPGMAFVLVSHLDPTHKSILAELLARSTKLPVSEVSDGMKVEPDHVYVMPPNTSMAIAEGVLRLQPREEGRAGRHPVDYFLHTLAEDQRHRAIGVILSGTDTDGTQGLESIKAEGGINFAQDPKSAQYDGMPRSAIAAGHVDFILTPEAIAKELARISRHPYASAVATPEEEQQPTGRSGFREILALLHKAKSVDFTDYKPNTLHRRIGRRMVLNMLGSLEDYARYLRENAAEVETLYQDILISVTSFFRNPEAFEVLKERIFPQVVEQRTPDEPIRIWTLGCSTGEEAYSIAISFAEFAGDQAEHIPVQIFATDLSDQGIEKARAGLYSKNITKDVPPERLRRFFAEADGGYRVSKPIRDMVVFARHNVIADPPFSRLDLISCRNLLIYLEPVLQKQVLPTLHYALKPTGVLWLGPSETVGAASDLFAPEGKKHRFYFKKPASARWHFQSGLGDAARQSAGSGQKIGHVSEQLRGEHDAQKEADRILLARYAPAGVVINAEMEILQVRGSTGAYLESPTGKATLNLLKMAREGLMLPLRVAIQKAKKDDQAIRKEGVRINYDGEFRQVNLEVIPIKGLAAHERCFLVLFESAAEGSGQKAVGSRQKAEGGKRKAGNHQAARLQEELAATREYMQSLVEQHEAANEELQSANEEIQSSNEELQSINEELETAKEELESGNEELATLNDELQNRNQELTTLNNDLNNLHASVNIPVLMLGRDLRIRGFTPQAEKVLSFIQADLGRPLGDIKPNINVPDLEELIVEVIDTVSIKEREVQDRRGRWYLMRVRPYETLDNKIDGAVVVLVDIDALKQSEAAIRESRDYAEAIIGTVREPLIVLDENLRVQTANRSFYKDFQVTAEETANRLFFDLGNHQWDIPKLRRLLEEILPENSRFQDFEVAHEFERIGRRTMLLNGRRLEQESSRTPLILLAIEDITERKQAEEALRDTHDELERRVVQRTTELLAANSLLKDEIGERKLAEEDLRKTKETLQTIFDAAPVAILGLDLEGRITNWSSGAQRMFGWSAEETTGHLCPTVPEDGLADFKAMIDLVVREGPQTGMVYYQQKKDGARIHCSISYGPLRDAAGIVVGVMLSLEDISELKQHQEELRRSEEQYRELVENINDVLYATDERGVITYISQVIEYSTGLRPSEITGHPFTEFVHAEDLPSVIESFQQSASGQARPTEFRVLDRSGKSHWLRKSSRPVFHGDRFAGTRGLLTDITERKRVEDALRETNQTLRTLIYASPLAIVGLDPGGNVEMWNPAAERIFGWSEEEVLGHYLPLVREDKREEFRSLREVILQGQVSSDVEVCWQKKDSSQVYISLSTAPIRDVEGEIIGIIGIMADITERKRVGEERRQLLRRLVTSQEDQQRRISRELHDQMGQYLAALMLEVKSLKDSAQFEWAKDGLERLQDLTSQLAQEAHNLAQELRPTALDDLGLHTAVLNYVDEWSERYKITADFHSNGLLTQRLPGHIETTVYRIVQEAMTNVLKHAKAKNVSIILEHRGSRVQVIVEDDGCGFDAEALIKTPVGHRRLGLLGMEERVTLAGGSLNIESTLGAGTTVLAHIPLSRDQLEADNGE